LIQKEREKKEEKKEKKKKKSDRSIYLKSRKMFIFNLWQVIYVQPKFLVYFEEQILYKQFESKKNKTETNLSTKKQVRKLNQQKALTEEGFRLSIGPVFQFLEGFLSPFLAHFVDGWRNLEEKKRSDSIC